MKGSVSILSVIILTMIFLAGCDDTISPEESDAASFSFQYIHANDSVSTEDEKVLEEDNRKTITSFFMHNQTYSDSNIELSNFYVRQTGNNCTVTFAIKNKTNNDITANYTLTVKGKNNSLGTITGSKWLAPRRSSPSNTAFGILIGVDDSKDDAYKATTISITFNSMGY